MYKITVYYGSIQTDDRNSRTTSGPTPFNHLDDTRAYAARVKAGGGEVVGDIVEVPGQHGFASLEEFDSVGRMTSDGLSLLSLEMRRGR